MNTYAQMKTSGPWHIRHVELDEELPSVPAEPNRHGCYVVFWWKELPLGDQWIPSEQLPVPAQQLKERALKTITPAVQDRLRDHDTSAAPECPLQQLHEQASVSKTDEPLPSVSVVVCTRDRPEQLKTCLRSLQQLSRSPEEILVVDNAPNTEATRQIAANVPDVRYVSEPHAGLDVARNTGIVHSTGDVIAFADDDVTVHPDWILRLQRGFRDPRVMAVTGLVLPEELETEAQFLFETHWSFNRGYAPKTFTSAYFDRMRRYGTPVWEIGAGANMAFRRRAFEYLGGFDERLDAGAAGCSGDSEMWYRVLAEGWHCQYEPDAVVYHHHRRRMGALEHQLHEYMRGHVTALLVQFEKYGHVGNLRRLLVSLPKYYTRRIITTAMGERQGMLWRELKGCLSGIAYYLQNRHRSSTSLIPCGTFNPAEEHHLLAE